MIDADADTWRPERPAEAPRQYLLWVDGAGGFLICLEPRITVGQAGSKTPDVPVLADISRHHVVIQRDTEGYFLETSRKVALNAQPAQRGLLKSGDRITLGNSCQLRFSQPVTLSASARLDLVSGHRFAQPVTAVLLMAETLVIGRGAQAHVTVDDLEKPIILFRPKEGLAVRYPGPLVISGQPCKERGIIAGGAQVSTDAVTFALECVPR